MVGQAGVTGAQTGEPWSKPWEEGERQQLGYVDSHVCGVFTIQGKRDGETQLLRT